MGNTLYTVPQGNVLCFAWQDNNIVTGLSTVHTVDKASDLVEKDTTQQRQLTSTSYGVVINGGSREKLATL